ncbi:helix-turn-helix transcriptional regulator [Clostridium botulinum]|uniref:helix-turn-helix transcriptional regulator n=1 Tax=Clostridium botulinum TaxID=1491 RepID=UPI0006994F9D|nr:helix-turn-helix transcriptional regulator [Clostridium botulinum]KOA94262.1 XRE family transcriptional regulator [Clostridium botulinum]MCD3204024.1 helix-turn-helix transcriptional regulator [Clostridium botulinum C/D]MCD3222276.1 helix-turn-helix transcriptional regulator [Clostridium botulinum C/D]MCD3232071.1 helix-turn-helix transcriptional regulator [Clostridium botulinum C/D]MCD3273049.1 helix-turn-helix transcriptional regulator [Clostridium botulinum C/D]
MNKLRKILTSQGMSVYKLAKKAKIGQATAHELANGKREPRISTACKIANVLGYGIEEIFLNAGEKNEN